MMITYYLDEFFCHARTLKYDHSKKLIVFLFGNSIKSCRTTMKANENKYQAREGPYTLLLQKLLVLFFLFSSTQIKNRKCSKINRSTSESMRCWQTRFYGACFLTIASWTGSKINNIIFVNMTLHCCFFRKNFFACSTATKRTTMVCRRLWLA